MTSDHDLPAEQPAEQAAEQPAEGPTRMDRLDFVSAIVLIAFGIGVLVESLRMPSLADRDINPYTVPGLVPGMLGIVLALCGLALLIRSTLRGGWRLGLTGATARGFFAARPVHRTALALGLTLVYALGLFGTVPFWLATMAFVFGFVVLSEAMARGGWPPAANLAIAAILAVAVGFGVNFVFQELFYVRLPG